MNNKLTKEDEIRIIELKKLKTPLNLIKNEFNIKNNKTIYDVLKRNGRDHIVGNKKYKVDENYFNVIDTESKSYWLGFLYADGYVRYKNDRSGELKLKLKLSDRGHIELFNKCLNSNYPIKDDLSVLKIKNKEYLSYLSFVGIYNTKMVNDLIKHGCMNNKTFKIKLPQLDEDLMRHFIRGYFDGDGSISNSKARKNSYTFSIASNDNFSYELSEYLKKYQIDNIVRKIGKISMVQITNRENQSKMYNLLYDQSTIFLNRKKLIFDDMMKNLI